MAEIEDLKSDDSQPASGLVIDSYLKKGIGATAVLLVKSGKIKKNDIIVSNHTFGKIKIIADLNHKPIDSAGSSMAVIVGGFKDLPEFGNYFKIVSSEKEARKMITDQKKDLASAKISGMSKSELIRITNRRLSIKQIPIVVKADLKGSLVSIVESILNLETEEVRCQIVGKGIGPITAKDVWLAKTTDAEIFSFNAVVVPEIEKLAQNQGVKINNYQVIYEILDKIKKDLENLLEPEIRITDLGTLLVKGVFKTTQTQIITGGQILDGQISLPARATVVRDRKEIRTDLEVVRLQKEQQQINQAQKGQTIGLSLKTKTKLALKVDDQLKIYRLEKIMRTL